MPDPAPTPPIDYAAVKAEDAHLGQQLRLILGGGLLFYGGCGAVGAAIQFATERGLIQTYMTYEVSTLPLVQAMGTAAMVAMSVVGPFILWGSRELMLSAAFCARLASAALILASQPDWAWSLGDARSSGSAIDVWHWIAWYVADAAFLVVPLMFWFLAGRPAVTRMSGVVR